MFWNWEKEGGRVRGSLVEGGGGGLGGRAKMRWYLREIKVTDF